MGKGCKHLMNIIGAGSDGAAQLPARSGVSGDGQAGPGAGADQGHAAIAQSGDQELLTLI